MRTLLHHLQEHGQSSPVHGWLVLLPGMPRSLRRHSRGHQWLLTRNESSSRSTPTRASPPRSVAQFVISPSLPACLKMCAANFNQKPCKPVFRPFNRTAINPTSLSSFVSTIVSKSLSIPTPVQPPSASPASSAHKLDSWSL